MSTAVRLYRMATRLLPPEIRREHGDEMVLVFSQQLTRAWGRSVLAAARLMGREALDLTRVVGREWRLELFGRDGVRVARHRGGRTGQSGYTEGKGGLDGDAHSGYSPRNPRAAAPTSASLWWPSPPSL